ncbi:MAG: hypothetical protein HQL29_03995 [Candidatus Omnitrophica bacterium]|nr:hypothetical protein [Candidatus Omnitrophota bacterium]
MDLDNNDLEKVLEELKKKNAQLEQATVKLIQSEKNAALSELASGMAHELNQPLNVVKIICQSLLRDIQKDRFDLEEAKTDLPEIIKQMDKMAKMVEHMRSFVKQSDVLVKESVDVNEVVNSMLKFVRQQFQSRGLTLAEELASNLPEIEADPNHLERALYNLAINARDAVDNKEVKTKRVIIKTEFSANEKSVIITINDTGAGWAPELKDKVFQPFYSNADVLIPDGKPGKTSGLGLFVSKKIIDEHGGNITIESEIGVGTTMRVALPVI